jgi:uncharacterized phage protein (TIGR01671 family)
MNNEKEDRSMREIKFRAFYKPLKIMVESDKVESINFETKVLGVYMPIEGTNFHKLRMSDFEMMQFAGVHDDEGEKIYSGHIVQLLHEGELINCEVIRESAGFLLCSNSFEDGFVWITDLLESDGGHFWIPKCKLIGNIYENHDLLK